MHDVYTVQTNFRARFVVEYVVRVGGGMQREIARSIGE
jgi:hypothetical protein